MSTEGPVTTIAPPVEAPVVSPEPAAPKSRAWLGVLAGLVVLALLVGATAVLFTRVQDAQDQADEAVTLAGNQEQLQTQLDQINATLADIQQGQTEVSDDVAALTTQLTALRKCVNTALDGFSQATQSGKPVAITKC